MDRGTGDIFANQRGPSTQAMGIQCSGFTEASQALRTKSERERNKQLAINILEIPHGKEFSAYPGLHPLPLSLHIS